METKPGFVYLIHAVGSNRYKIGITMTTVQARLKQLNREQSPYPLVVVHSIPSDYPRETEKILHLTFKANKAHNEWFTFSTQPQVMAVVTQMDQLIKKNDERVERVQPLLPTKLPPNYFHKKVEEQEAVRKLQAASERIREETARKYAELEKIEIRETLYPPSKQNQKSRPKLSAKSKGKPDKGIPLWVWLALFLTWFLMLPLTQNPAWKRYDQTNPPTESPK